MPSDDNETKPEEPLPPSVERALAAARAPAAAKSSRWLALIPITAAVLMFLLIVPSATPPEDIPLPQVDGVALHNVINEDTARAADARKNRLPGDILAVGTALRAINKAAAAGDAEGVTSARLTLDDAQRGLTVRTTGVVDQMKTLRAVQLDEFLVEVQRFESTGQPSTELLELGGGFIERMGSAGWMAGQKVLLDDAQRRVAFKLQWTGMVHGEKSDLALTLDEQRALYTLYLTHPRAPDAQRGTFELMRRGAANEDECRTVVLKERLAAELWRADKIRKLGEIDPAYPMQYALGVAYYRAGRYDMSTDAFRTWLDQHPNGPLALRARNHWKAAFLANGPG